MGNNWIKPMKPCLLVTIWSSLRCCNCSEFFNCFIYWQRFHNFLKKNLCSVVSMKYPGVFHWLSVVGLYPAVFKPMRTHCSNILLYHAVAFRFEIHVHCFRFFRKVVTQRIWHGAGNRPKNKITWGEGGVTALSNCQSQCDQYEYIYMAYITASNRIFNFGIYGHIPINIWV